MIKYETNQIKIAKFLVATTDGEGSCQLRYIGD